MSKMTCKGHSRNAGRMTTNDIETMKPKIKNFGFWPVWKTEILVICLSSPGLKSHEKSALLSLFINNQNCSVLNQYWISAVNYLKISEQRCSALKTLFPREKKSALYSSVSQLIFSQSALKNVKSLKQRCLALNISGTSTQAVVCPRS